MKKKIIYTLFFLVFFGKLEAQNLTNLDASIVLLKQQLVKFKTNRDTLGIINSSYLLAKKYSDKTKYNEAEKLLLKAVALAKAKKFVNKIGLLYLQLGINYRYSNKIKEASTYFFKAKSIFLKLKDGLNYTTTLVDIAEFYRKFDETPLAIKTIDEAVLAFQKNKLTDTLLLIRIYNRKAAIFYNESTPDSTIYYSNKALLLAEKIKNADLQATSLNEIASVLGVSDIKKSIAYLEKAEKLWKNIGAEREMLNAMRNRAILYSETEYGSKKIAPIYKEFMHSVNKKNSNQSTSNMNRLMMLEYEEMGDIAKAYKYSKLYFEAIQEEDYMKHRTQIAQITEQLENDKIKNQVRISNEKLKISSLLVDQKKKEINQSYLFSFALFIFLSVIVFLYFRTRLSKKIILQQRNSLSVSLKERETLLKELHHRVKNNLQVISGILQLQVSKTNDGEVSAIFTDAMRKINSMALVHEMLFSQEEYSSVPASNYITQLTKEIFEGFDATHISYSIDCENIHLAMNKAIPLGLIITELLTNAYKHAFDDRNGSIHLSLKNNGKHQLEFIYKDNGKGLPAEQKQTISKSMGLKLIHMLAEELNGNVVMNGNNGLLVTINFRIDA